MKSKTDLKNLAVKIGHYTNKKSITGCTAILFDEPATCGVSVAGGAPGTRETDFLDPTCLVEKVNAILLTGGSAFGLTATDGVLRYLSEKKIGFAVQDDLIPIVPAAVIYDRGIGEKSHPTLANGYKACVNASYITPISGNIGVGTGATVGKWSKTLTPSLGGFSAVTGKAGKISAVAIFAVNAFGNIVNPSGEIVAGANNKGKMIPFTSGGSAGSGKPMGNTTIGVIVTDAALTKAEAKRVAMAAHDGLARATSPAHTIYDGDTIFVASTGKKRVDMLSLCALAADLTAEAIVTAVRR